jgi:type III secretion protein R
MDPLYLLLVFSAMSMVPLLAVMVTSYTKIIIVTSLLRNALGLQNVPPPTVTSGIAIILTFFVMYPVGYEALGKQDHLRGGMQLGNTTQMLGLAQSAREPLRKFLAKHSGEKERQFFLQTAKEIMPPEVAADIKPDDLVILAPAFTLSELTSAFEIGFLLFLPFILIDHRHHDAGHANVVAHHYFVAVQAAAFCGAGRLDQTFSGDGVVIPIVMARPVLIVNFAKDLPC